ncbi:hypothetical protein VD0002_g4585 [Verticillium dahliae]|uniref:Uncharacterized protein n=1 Tax=Verticillium dahliae TaxID=27337 RepID=A0AA45AQC8_VERDA|nr:hypothetical protein BJF96_g531 [Verticillium dahliae]PNH44063.1 hypothetical protein VD0004_g3526 [Verticillium dahliae]PNH55087.1 hypothetical protein VD0003_g2481 [Verticillium dahliae]PNH63914.1 hypothetical protein VD0002_g4585 [Verticillium dahliae]PNH73998.1 hypothetical protein VD0001_g3568 [Verticillium dahliae]
MPPCFSRPNANRGVIDLKSCGTATTLALLNGCRAFVSPYCPSA